MCNKVKNFNTDDFIMEEACSSSHASKFFSAFQKIKNVDIFFAEAPQIKKHNFILDLV